MTMKKKYKLLAVVEGPGDEDAIPFMLRTWFFEKGVAADFVTSNLAVKAKSCGRLTAKWDEAKHLGIEHYVSIALLDDPDAVIVILDADKECITRAQNGSPPFGPELLARAKSVAGTIPVSVVVADPEMEIWYLAAQEHLISKKMLSASDLLQDEYFDQPRSGCKGTLAKLLGRKYDETSDQPRLASKLSFADQRMYRCRSFKKLVKELDSLCKQVMDS
jgi:Domain of unknown function (DUF4276)